VADQLKILQDVLAKDGELAELTAVMQERDRTIAAFAAHSMSPWSASRLAHWLFTSQRG
jgi:hypothetical protein